MYMKKVKFQRIPDDNIMECVKRLNEKIEDEEIGRKDIISINWRPLPKKQQDKRPDGSKTHEELSIFYWGN